MSRADTMKAVEMVAEDERRFHIAANLRTGCECCACVLARRELSLSRAFGKHPELYGAKP